MHKALRFFSFRRAPILLVITLILAGCGGGGGGGGAATEKTLNDQLKDYADSLHKEHDWLSDRSDYAKTNYEPDAKLCKAKTFKHPVPKLDAKVKEEDKEAVDTIALMDWIAEVQKLAHDQWDKFCAGEAGSTFTSQFIRTYLDSVETSQAQIDTTIERRFIQATDTAAAAAK